ncbi:hypothetical protein MZM54_01490 [[Brevibacterium] frigoritolerans]|nr:hypothetical protein [Peribacillus frigoritolerans]
MSDIFKMLLEGAQKTRTKKATNDKLKSILNNQETSDYENRNAGIGSADLFSDFDDDFSIGEERDSSDYLSDVKKLSMKELDKKPPKEQLKILKLEYNRLFDKLNFLNDSVSNGDRLISDLQMERRNDEEEVRQMKDLIRKIVHLFPGQTDLKTTVDKGYWKVADVFERIENIVVTVLNRVKQADSIIEEEVGKAKMETIQLKEKVLQYKEYFSKIQELEQLVIQQQQMIHQQQQVQPVQTGTIEHTQPIIEPAPTPASTPTSSSIPNPVPSQETPDIETEKNITDISQKNRTEETNTIQNTADHNPHFSSFFSEFKESFNKMKEDEKQKSITEKPVEKTPPPSPTPEPKQVQKPVEPLPPIQPTTAPTSSNLIDNNPTPHSKHPLSPDYIETEKEEVDDLFDETIDAYLQNLSVQQEYLLTIIGKTGISRNSDLKDYLKEDALGQQYYYIGKKYNSNALNRDIAELRDKGILSDEQVSYGGKGGGTFNVYELSQTGKSCFKKIASDNPVVPEKKRIVGHHASLEHGYLIKDSAKLFREMGYKVYTDLEDVSFKIDPQHRKVFDFIVEDEEGKLLHIEVERGTHTQDGFSNAMDKIYEITKDFYFICPNEQVKNKNTKKKFFTWVTKTLGGIQNADVTLYMTTIENLRKKSKNLWEVTDLRNVK